MTFIAVNTTAANAEIITDTWTYEPTAATLGRMGKTTTLLHLNTVIAVQGGVEFAALWAVNASVFSQDLTDFDELNQGAPDALRETWDSIDEKYTTQPALVLHVGYSRARGTFETVTFSSLDGFEPKRLESPFVHPAPLDVRASDHELARFRDAIDNDEVEYPDAQTKAGVHAAYEANYAHLAGQPTLSAPTDQDGWVALAEQARAQRSTLTPRSLLKVLVGGDLHYTKINLLGAYTQRIHSFNDAGDELATIMRYTEHPLGLAGPCPCNSGSSYADCHFEHERADLVGSER